MQKFREKQAALVVVFKAKVLKPSKRFEPKFYF